jgi:hypothetical protein
MLLILNLDQSNNTLSERNVFERLLLDFVEVEEELDANVESMVSETTVGMLGYLFSSMKPLKLFAE